jgi:hypothetical protein
MASLLQSYKHIGIREVPRREALELCGALEAHGASCAHLGWGRVVFCEWLDGECVRVMVPDDGAQLAVVRWDAPEDGGRRVEMDAPEVYEAAPVVRGSNGGRAVADALLARIGVKVGARV